MENVQTTNIPMHQLNFSIKDPSTDTFLEVKDLENLSLSFENGIEEWKPLDLHGWTKRLVTSKSLTVSVTGKRNYDDAGNNFVAGFAMKSGMDCEVEAKITFPSGSALNIKGVIDVKSIGGGDSTAVSPIEFDILSNGKPTFTATAQA